MTHGSAVSDLKWMALKGFRPELVQMALEKKLLALERRERTRSVSCRKEQNQRFRFFANITFRQLSELRKPVFARFHGFPGRLSN